MTRQLWRKNRVPAGLACGTSSAGGCTASGTGALRVGFKVAFAYVAVLFVTVFPNLSSEALPSALLKCTLLTLF